MPDDLICSSRVLCRDSAIISSTGIPLALGIGANAVIVSLMGQVVFRSLRVEDPKSLVVLRRECSLIGTSSRPIPSPSFRVLCTEISPIGAVDLPNTPVHIGAPVRMRNRGLAVAATADRCLPLHFRGVVRAAGSGLPASSFRSSDACVPEVALHGAIDNPLCRFSVIAGGVLGERITASPHADAARSWHQYSDKRQSVLL